MAIVCRRSYDRLRVERVVASPSTSWTVLLPDSGGWPYAVVYAIAGSARIHCAEFSVAVAEGQLSVLRNGSRLEIRAAHGADLLVLSLPDSGVDPYHYAVDAASGRVWSTSSGTGFLVGGLLAALATQLDGYSSDNPGRLAQHIVGLVGVMCADAAAPIADPGGEVSLQQIKQYIDDHLGDVDLTLRSIAWTYCMSSRTLRRRFESDGLTVSGWIRLRRIEQCRVDLLDAACEALPVSEIGARWGLSPAAHFSRLFKSSCGISPQAFRVAHRSRRRPFTSLTVQLSES